MDASSSDLNYCTWWPDRIGAIYYGDCCKQHDLMYRQDVPRFDADLQLAQCVYSKTASPTLTIVMFIGVVLFGWAFQKFGKWRRRK